MLIEKKKSQFLCQYSAHSKSTVLFEFHVVERDWGLEAVLVPLFINYVTLGKFLSLSDPQFSRLSDEHNHIHLLGRWLMK